MEEKRAGDHIIPTRERVADHIVGKESNPLPDPGSLRGLLSRLDRCRAQVAGIDLQAKPCSLRFQR